MMCPYKRQFKPFFVRRPFLSNQTHGHVIINTAVLCSAALWPTFANKHANKCLFGWCYRHCCMVFLYLAIIDIQ